MEGGAHSYRIKNFITMASRKRFLAFDSSEDDTQPTTFTFKANENFAKFLVISSKEDKPITSLSPFIIEKQIESLIGTPKTGLGGSVGCASDWRPGGRGFDPRQGRQHSFVEIDHEIFSTVILSLPLIQEGQLSVSGERMCTILVNR